MAFLSDAQRLGPMYWSTLVEDFCQDVLDDLLSPERHEINKYFLQSFWSLHGINLNTVKRRLEGKWYTCGKDFKADINLILDDRWNSAHDDKRSKAAVKLKEIFNERWAQMDDWIDNRRAVLLQQESIDGIDSRSPTLEQSEQSQSEPSKSKSWVKINSVPAISSPSSITMTSPTATVHSQARERLKRALDQTGWQGVEAAVKKPKTESSYWDDPHLKPKVEIQITISEDYIDWLKRRTQKLAELRADSGVDGYIASVLEKTEQKKERKSHLQQKRRELSALLDKFQACSDRQKSLDETGNAIGVTQDWGCKDRSRSCEKITKDDILLAGMIKLKEEIESTKKELLARMEAIKTEFEASHALLV